MCIPLPGLLLLRSHSWPCLTFMGTWVAFKCLNLSGQADSQQGIATRLASDTGHWCSYILWYVGLITVSIYAIWPYKNFWIRAACHFMATHHHQTIIPIEVIMVLTSWFKKGGHFSWPIYWRVHPLNALDDCRLIEKCIQAALCILEI